MSGIMSDATVMGGGYGGFGGGFGGIAPVGLFGLIGADGFGNHGRDGGKDCDSKLLQMFSDSVNEKFNALDAHITQGQLQEEISDVEEAVRDNGMAMERDFGDVKAGLKELSYHGALNTKDIIMSQKDCCCETKEAIVGEACKTRELMLAIENKNTERALCDSKAENIVLRGKLDNDKQTHHLEHYLQALVYRMDSQDTAIGNIITGAGNTVSTNRNSGTQVK